MVTALLRIMELYSGEILIDGQNVAQVGLSKLRKAIQIIPQSKSSPIDILDPVLFQGSIRSNLDPSTTYTDDDLWKALERVNMKKFVSEQELKLNAPVELQGENLSVGERQLLTLASAILAKPKILIMVRVLFLTDIDRMKRLRALMRRAVGRFIASWRTSFPTRRF